MAKLVQPLAALHDAIDRVQACLSGLGAPCQRQFLEIAAQDVMRALVQTRRRCHELEQQVANEAAQALDRVATVLSDLEELEESRGGVKKETTGAEPGRCPGVSDESPAMSNDTPRPRTMPALGAETDVRDRMGK